MKTVSNKVLDFPEWLGILRSRLSAMIPERCIAFAASCCERLMQNYLKFARDARWGNPEELAKSLSLLWELAATDGKVADSRIREAIAICDSSAPHTEQFNSLLTSAALDAANSIAEALEFAMDKNVEHLVTVSSLSRDTIDLFIQRRDGLKYSDEEFESKIARDPLMVAELAKQQRDVQIVESVLELTPEFLASFRADSLSAGRDEPAM
jgi:uncharacterized protein YjaG (DUF416 family)